MYIDILKNFLFFIWILTLSSCTDLLNQQIGIAENIKLGFQPQIINAQYGGMYNLDGENYYCIEIKDLHPHVARLALLLSASADENISILSDQVLCSSFERLVVDVITQSTDRFYCSAKSPGCNLIWSGYPSQIKLLEYVSRNQYSSYSVDYMIDSNLSVNNSNLILDIKNLKGPSILGCMLRVGYIATIPADILITYPLSYLFDFSDQIKISVI